MFNLLVAAHGEFWEGERLSMFVDRFKEYSGVEGDAVNLDQPDTLRRLEEVPTLLMYEVGTAGPNARLVRHGRIRNVARRGADLTFTFELDPERAYLDRGVILAFADQLGLHRFEQHRTHWAIKDGDLPSGLLEAAVAERPQRTVAVVAAEYIKAKGDERRRETAVLEEELAQFPPSLEKALSLLPARLLGQATPEIYPVLGVEPGSLKGRAALEAVLARNQGNENARGWSYSLAWFLGVYGSPTEAEVRDNAVQKSALHMRGLAVRGDPNFEDLGEALWRCARSPLLVGGLRHEVSASTNRLIASQSADGWWLGRDADGDPAATVRGTALATVALQRIGDDRHHRTIGRAVAWLIDQRREDDGAFPRWQRDDADVVATVVTLEAIRRSNLAEAVPHVLAAGEVWLVSSQTVLGGWTADPWPEDFVAATVLDYLRRRGAILPQVDGFLLMARDFFRRAEALCLEGGSNNRRMAAIAAVHAVEMFLYGLFERRDDLALSPFKENGAETLGPREALRALQDSLQRIGVLAAPRRLKHRDQLSSLIGHRDGIIHRAHEISEAELDAGLRHARKFIETYGPMLINLDLLQ
jgi:hypothetical protein